jgi:hypothetical protein
MLSFRIRYLIRPLAVANGAINQFRILGGSVGLSIVVCASSSRLRRDLLSVLTPSEVAMVLNRTDEIQYLPEDTQRQVRIFFGQSYQLQMLIVVGIAAANIPATFLLWKKNQVRLSA